MFAIKSSKDELNWKSFNGNVGYDGILGLSPVDKLVNTNYISQSANLIFKLADDDFISEPTFSIYVSSKPGNTSYIKFGGWDLGAIQGKFQPTFIPSSDGSSYLLMFR